MQRNESRRSYTQSDAGNCSRASSRKKFLNVVSKPSNQPNVMRQSIISMPDRPNVPIFRSQAKPVILSASNIHRSSSQPHIDLNDRVIIRETVRAVPVNFKYLDSKSISLNSNQICRHSLPTKREIIMTNSKNMHPFTLMQVSQPQPRHSIIYQPAPLCRPKSIISHHTPPPQVFRPSIIHTQSRSSHSQRCENTLRSLGQPVESVQMYSHYPPNVLNNSRYINFQVNLGNCADPQKTVRSKYDTSQTENYNSLEVIKGDTQKNLKQNLDIRIQERIQNFSKCEQIKINPKQALQPKKNFMFI